MTPEGWSPGQAPVVVERVDRVALVRLNRPAALNAMTLALVDELHDVLTDVANDESVSVVILTGTGPGFCAGHDIDEFGDSSAGVDAAVEIQDRMSSLVPRLRSLPQPVVAAVNGPAAGGGFALAAACDIRLCDEAARFSAAFLHVGLAGTDMGLSYILPRIVGTTLSSELLLTGRTMGAREAADGGFVSRVVPVGEVLAAALELAQSMASHGRTALRITKRTLWAGLEAGSLAAAVETENHAQALLLQSDRHRELVARWLAERAARHEADR